MYGATGDVEKQGSQSPTSSWKALLWQGWEAFTGASIIILAICFQWFSGVLQSLMVMDAIKPTHYFHKDTVLYDDPLALTGIINGIAAGVALMLWMSSEGFKRFVLRPNSSEEVVGIAFTWQQLRLFILSGIMEGFERGLGNLALEHVSISLRTMLTSTNIFFTFVFAVSFALEPAEKRRVLAIGVLVVGGVVQGMGARSGGVSVFGVCMVMISVVAGSLRWTILNVAMSLSPRGAPKMMLSDKFRIISIAKPFDCALCICFSLAVGHHHWATPEGELVKMWIFMALNIVVVVFFELIIVQYAGAVAAGVVVIIGNIWMVLAGICLNQERASTWQYIGFAFCIVGSICYTLAARSPHEAAKPEVKKQHD